MRYLLLVLSALLLSCGGDDGGITAPDTGSLEIRASTIGEAATDYMVSIDGGSGRTVAPNGTLTVSDLELGFHTVGIVAPPPGCTVVGDNPRTVSVVAGSTNVVTFEVNCVPLLGSIQVTTVTTGTGPASYDLVMDGTSIGPIGSSVARVIQNVPPGPHTINLGSVPATCQVQGESTQTVTVEPSASAAVTFSITCTGPSGGTLNVTVSTSGPDTDPDGYQVVVDGGSPQPIGVNATITLTSLAAGNHTVRLDGVAANCSVSGPNPQTVSIPANGTATVTFAATCAASQPTTGTLRITTATSGSDVDSDGYLVTINDREPVEIGADDELSLDLEPGNYTVTLSGVAGNCTVSSAEQTAEVTAGATEEVEFEITCRPVGTLRVSTESTGPDADDNGYVLLLDGQDFGRIGINEERTINNLTPGDYIVQLGEVAENCDVADENPRTVTVTEGGTAETAFDVTCSEPTGSIEITTTTSGAEPDEDGYFITVDEGEEQPIEANDVLTLDDVAQGDHTVVLSGVAPNCTVSDGTTREIQVTAAEAEPVRFDVECASSSNARR